MNEIIGKFRSGLVTGLMSITLVLILISCGINAETEAVGMASDNKKFLKVELNSDSENDCSPQVDPEEDFSGIVIAAPSEVIFELGKPSSDGQFAAMPICGFYQLDMADMMKNATIRLFAKNIETEEIYNGAMLEQDPGSEAPLPFDEPPMNPEDFRGQFIGAYFNPNLPNYVNIPALPAKYQVLVQIGETKSNIVEIEVKKK